MRACVGAFIMIAVWSVFAHFMRDTPADEEQAKQRAEANINRLLEQWSDWEYARAFDVGNYLCSPVHNYSATEHTK